MTVAHRLAQPIVDELLRDADGDLADVVVFVEHAFAVYDVQPIINALKGRATVYLYCPSFLIGAASDYLGLALSDCTAVELLATKAGARFSVYAELLMVPYTFSTDYAARKARRMTVRDARVKRVVTPLTGRIVKYVNKRFVWACQKLGLGAPSDTPLASADAVLSFTKVYKPYLLTQLKGRHVNIMESWDHPSKEPYLIDPDVHFTWNEDLANRTSQYQLLRDIKRCLPLKFRYLLEESWVEGGKEDGRIIYPMCTSSKFTGFDGEVSFVRDLAATVERMGYSLTIRPYPLAPPEDKAALLQLGSIDVEDYPVAPHSLEQLDPAYYTQKIESLRGTALVINVGTTYAFDAALAGVPVVQVSPAVTDYGEFSSYIDAEHIKLYLNDEYTLASEELSDADDLALLVSRGRLTSNRMRTWLLGDDVDLGPTAPPPTSTGGSTTDTRAGTA